MSFVRTLTRDIAPGEMGVTYSHEHIVCRPPYWLERSADDLILESPSRSILDIQDFVNLGGKTIVDATAIDYGRDVPAVAKIAEKTGVHIIGTAGFNKGFLWSAKLPEHLKPIVGDYKTYADWIRESTVDKLTEHVVKEVEAGLEGTGCRAGQVKLGTGYNSITPLEEKTLIAVAQAHKQTKAPVHCHTEAGTMALEQIGLLKREGVEIENVSFGHMDRNLDLYYYEKILSYGGYLCFDGIGKIKYGPESARIEAIMTLCRRGYENRILISHDLARKSYYRHYNYGIGMRFILEKWAPRFAEECAAADLNGKALLAKFLVANPARCFTFKS